MVSGSAAFNGAGDALWWNHDLGSACSMFPKDPVRSGRSEIRMPDPGAFTLSRQQDAVVFHVQPARAAFAYLAASLLLGMLFGLPSLAVLVSPARHDPASLAAAAAGLLIAMLAGTAFLRARRARHVQQIRVDSHGLSWTGGALPWSAIRRVRLARPKPASPTGGIHGLAAGIATQQGAVSARLLLEPRDGSATLALTPALGADVAEALRTALLRHAPRSAADVLTSEVLPQ
jgi:hypothetical protein